MSLRSEGTYTDACQACRGPLALDVHNRCALCPAVRVDSESVWADGTVARITTPCGRGLGHDGTHSWEGA